MNIVSYQKCLLLFVTTLHQIEAGLMHTNVGLDTVHYSCSTSLVLTEEGLRIGIVHAERRFLEELVAVFLRS